MVDSSIWMTIKLLSTEFISILQIHIINFEGSVPKSFLNHNLINS